MISGTVQSLLDINPSSQEEGHQVHEMQNEPEVHGDCPYRPFAGTFCNMACRMAQHMVKTQSDFRFRWSG